MTTCHRLLAVALTALGCAAAQAQQDHPDHHEAPPREAMPAHEGMRPAPHPALPQLDARYNHDHYYPPHGVVVGGLPAGSVGVAYRGGRYYFHGGVWFRAQGPGFIVVAPPLGIVVPLLPPAYTTLWIAGAPYYYANGTYYAPAGDAGYAVVAPPPGADTAPGFGTDPGQDAPPMAQATPVPPPPPPGSTPATGATAAEPIIYPRNGQSAEQTESDRRECNRWATTQPNAVADAGVFQRAVEACMDGRGYTLR